MKILPALLLLFFVLPSGGFKTQINNLQTQRASVVLLRIQHAQSGSQTAAGIFAGKDQNKAYFITAYHALDPDKGGEVKSVELQFFSSPQSFKASVLDRFDADLDLGVVTIDVTTLPPMPRLPFRPAAADIVVHVIGHPPAGDWSTWPGHVQNENAPSGDVRHFIINRDDSLAHGYSGGPVFDSNGNFLGIHLETTATYGRELKSDEIIRVLSTWRVPTNNFDPATSLIGVPDPRLDQLSKGEYDGSIRLGYGAGLYLSDTFGLTTERGHSTWVLQRSSYKGLPGYWIFKPNVREAWQCVPRGSLSFWNADKRAKGDPDHLDLFTFEIVGAPSANRVRVKSFRLPYVRYDAAAALGVDSGFRCDGLTNGAAIFSVEF